MIPFSKRKKSKNFEECVVFYEHDIKFKTILTATKKYLDDLKKYSAVVSPDCSLYRDMPLAVQIINTYMSRAVGSYLQNNGVNIIPNIRWSDERSYSDISVINPPNQNLYPEKPFAFCGVEKHGIYSIGTYGCINGEENMFHFKEGLKAMIYYLEPKTILVYGTMQNNVFDEYKEKVQFVHYEDWITSKFRKNK